GNAILPGHQGRGDDPATGTVSPPLPRGCLVRGRLLPPPAGRPPLRGGPYPGSLSPGRDLHAPNAGMVLTGAVPRGSLAPATRRRAPAGGRALLAGTSTVRTPSCVAPNPGSGG